jgi:4-hydroxybenzoate polyprenyltransferase
MASKNSRLYRRLITHAPEPSTRCLGSISSLQRLGVPRELSKARIGNLCLRSYYWAAAHSASLSSSHGSPRKRLLVQRSSSWSPRPLLYEKIKSLSTQATGNNLPPTKHDDENEKKANNENRTTAADHRVGTSSADPTAISLTWVDHYLPRSAQPYARLARLDKPIGTWLLFWPCAFSTALAAVDTTTSVTAGTAASLLLPDPYLLTLFAMGSAVMRGAGCTINDLLDRHYDKQVERCKTRPLAAGDVTVPQAIMFLSLQLTTGLAVLLSLPHTLYCFYWGVASLPLVATYPLMKRFFPYPQLVLGLTFNWGVWMGWAAVHGDMDYSITAPLYLSCVCWTLVYDTIYGHQDKHDDAKLGLHSTALTFGSDDAVQKQILYSLATASGLSWLYIGQVADLAMIYNVGAMAAYGHLLWQINTADLNEPHNLAERFRSNQSVGAILFGSIVAGKFFA